MAPLMVLHPHALVLVSYVTALVAASQSVRAFDCQAEPLATRVVSSVTVEMPVPPRAADSCPVHPAVMLVAFTRAVEGEPPSVRVTLVSLVRVRAAPVVLVRATPST